MQEVVKRLRQLKRDEEGGEYHEGEVDGKRWAMNTATLEQLENLEELRAGLPGDEWDLWFHRQDDIAKSLANVFVPNIKIREFRTFWRTIRPSKGQTEDYYRGFADGAIEVWDEVKTHI